MTPIALVVGFFSIVTFVCAVPQPSASAQPSRVLSVPPLVPTGQPNVALFDLPATITPPTGEKLNSVFIGYGSQNYSCNPSTLTYFTNDTAEAKLYDVTCLYTGSTAPTTYPPLASLTAAINHFYVPNPQAPSTVIPRFELIYSGQFFEGTKNATVANAIPTFSVAAALLQNVEGSLADWVVRTNVVGGAVPAVLDTCAVGDQIGIPYKANYLFFSK